VALALALALALVLPFAAVEGEAGAAKKTAGPFKARAKNRAKGQKSKARGPRWPGDFEAGGRHLRRETDHGPLHLWLPRGYDAQTAELVVYVHGLYNTVDEAWETHRLARQFAKSGKNALFVAPEAPVSGSEPPRWDSLGALCERVYRILEHTAVPPPQDPLTTVVGHSGAYRTITPWLNEPIHHIVLVDALYGNEDDFAAWIDQAAKQPDGEFTRQLTIVAWDTLRWTEPFTFRFDDVQWRVGVPGSANDFTPEQRHSRILYILSQYGHMELVQGGQALPVLLGQIDSSSTEQALR
jgi:hypothetical protein